MIRLNAIRARAVLAAGLLLAMSGAAEAGPPLICHPFDTGGAASLPWRGGPGWNLPDPTYDLARLVDDTVRLLTPSLPVPARMETLRRATIYAAGSREVAAALLERMVARARQSDAAGTPDAFAWFDAGYLVESYRQASRVYKWEMVAASERASWLLREEPSLDGLGWIRRAASLKSGEPAAEMVHAAQLVSSRR